jgi:DNA polymerase/3'-5' exonuclease PolX
VGAGGFVAVRDRRGGRRGRGTRLALPAAVDLANDITSQIRGEAHVVGSIRRRKPTVGDIEIAVHVDAEVSLDVAEGGMFPGEYATVKGGGKPDWRYWQLRHLDGYMLDLFRFDDQNRGSIMLIRTGPAAFSKHWVTALREIGLRHEGGYVKHVREGRVIPCRTEQDAFALAGMEYVEPWERR